MSASVRGRNRAVLANRHVPVIEEVELSDSKDVDFEHLECSRGT